MSQRTYVVLVLMAVLAAACAPILSDRLPAAGLDPRSGGGGVPEVGQPADETAAEPRPTPRPTEVPETADVELLPPETPPRGSSQFTTDFSRHTVPYSEILSGGPPKDGIPAIDKPLFVDPEVADTWLKPREPVVLVEIGDEAKAYPLSILTWHEIVNDEVGDTPVTVTFCPLCNTAIAFERTFDGQVLDFGTSGRLRYSNLIMYDRQTETWWQQATGEGIAGKYAGRQLELVPAAIVSWEDYKTAHPEGKVLSTNTGHVRSYGTNPYVGYDDIDSSPFLFDGPRTPGTLPPMARVATVDLGQEAVAYPYDVMAQVHVVDDTVAGEDLVVIWQKGVASALDSGSIASGRDVGSVNVFSRRNGDTIMTFRWDARNGETGAIVDNETGSEWNLLGQAVAGPLQGTRLSPVVTINHFWFSWAAFRPETRVYEPS